MKAFWSVAVVVVVVVLLLSFTFSRWGVTVEINGDNLKDVHITALVDGKSIGDVSGSGVLSTEVKNGKHLLSVEINGRTIVQKSITLPVFSFNKKKRIKIEMPPIGNVNAMCLDEKGNIVYKGPYPIDKWKLKIDDKYLKVNHRSFKCDFGSASVEAVLYGYIGNSKVVEKKLVLKRNTVNTVIELRGNPEVSRHVNLFLDNQPVKPNEKIKVIPGKHQIVAKIKDTVVSSNDFLIDKDLVYVINVPKLSRISSPTLRVEGNSVKIFWNLEKLGIVPEEFIVESSYGEKKRTKESFAKLPYHESTVVYTITPLYFDETIKGSTLSLTKPLPPKIDIEGVSAISSTCVMKPIINSNGKIELFLNGRKVDGDILILDEGENILKVVANDVVGQTSIEERKIICDTVPPAISFEMKGELFRVTTSEPATVVLNGEKTLQVDRWLSVYDLPASFTLTAIDKAANVSEKHFILLKKPKISAKMISPDKLAISIIYDYPYDYFLLDVGGKGYRVSRTSTVVSVPIKKVFEISASAVYKDSVGPREIVKVKNHYVKGRVVSGELKDIKGGYYTVIGSLILSNPKISSNATFLIAENSNVLLKGQIDCKGKVAFLPLYKKWKGLVFEGESLSGIRISDARVAIRLVKDTKLKSITVENSNVGILTSNGSFILSNVVVKDSKTSVLSYGSRLYLYNSKFENFDVAINLFDGYANVRKNEFIGSGTGINSQNSFAIISASTFKDNKEGIRIFNSTLLVMNNRFINDGIGIRAISSTLMVESSEFIKNKKAIYMYRQRKDCSVHNSLFKDNKLDMFLMGTEDVRVVPLNSVKKFIDGRVQPTWIDDRGKVKDRGKIVEGE